jgi:RNA polymerase sigma-70 factor (ECF subfamily)
MPTATSCGWNGRIVPRWDRAADRRGCGAGGAGAGDAGRFGSYCLQAAIAAVHAESGRAEETDWRQICALYDALLERQPSPVIALNRAVAVARVAGPAAGLALVDGLLARGELLDYHLAHATRADFCRRLGRVEEARAACRRALALATSERDQRHLEGRLRELG